jgi:hypothetical protein
VGREEVWSVGSCVVAPWQGGHGDPAAFLSLLSVYTWNYKYEIFKTFS